MSDLPRRIRRLEQVVARPPSGVWSQIIVVRGGLPEPLCATLLDSQDQLVSHAGESEDVFRDRAVTWAIEHCADIVVISGHSIA
jgi:hypothetical protein